ncbi:hypothetical protein V5O48_005255 [Marasmius crinis-equi]|uniref:Uncharacterized protein n=1 Tax=Marasmius crinis-equi TaxID=585013 RepID=A0ABR3FN72_9AGAR
MESRTESESTLSVTFPDAELTKTATESGRSIRPEIGSYLGIGITKDYDRQRCLKIVPCSPPETPIERSFNVFTKVLGPTLLCAQWTLPSLTAPGSAEEFKQFGDRLGVAVDLVVPESHSTSRGNLLEVKRMLLTSAVKWMDHWRQSLPDGAEIFWLCQNLMREISRNARMRAYYDSMLIPWGKRNEVSRYRDYNWGEVMEAELKKVAWKWI